MLLTPPSAILSRMNLNHPLIPINDVDRCFYAERLEEFLPENIVDIHTHVYRDSDFPSVRQNNSRSVSWPARVAKDNPIEDLLETYRLMLPGKKVTPMIFPTVPRGGNLDVQNSYVSACSHEKNIPALIFSDPTWSATETETRIRQGGFIGAKSYLSVAPAYIPGKEIRIFDFFPPHQLEVHNRNGWIVMLHIPRDGRLRDPVNLAQMMQIEQDYPNIRLIIAHVGRAYCDEDVGNAFEVLSQTEKMSFDFCANTNANVFEQALRCVGPRRILFGSDMPILRMRMKRITRDGRYVNLVPRGLYGDVSNDPNMGELDGAEAAALTFFLYEEIEAFRVAAKLLSLGHEDIEDVFYNNAVRLFDGLFTI